MASDSTCYKALYNKNIRTGKIIAVGWSLIPALSFGGMEVSRCYTVLTPEGLPQLEREPIGIHCTRGPTGYFTYKLHVLSCDLMGLDFHEIILENHLSFHFPQKRKIFTFEK